MIYCRVIECVYSSLEDALAEDLEMRDVVFVAPEGVEERQKWVLVQ
jgi:hypothetical protein